MSGWTILTARGFESCEYDRSRYDEHDRYDATSDIVASFEADDRIRKWTTWKSHVYAYLNACRYNFEFAEELMSDYGDLIDDAVVLGANDTSDTGTARYYERPDLGRWTDEYQETQSEDGTYVGELALSVISVRHGIVAKDPFHNEVGLADGRYLKNGTDFSE